MEQETGVTRGGENVRGKTKETDRAKERGEDNRSLEKRGRTKGAYRHRTSYP